MTTGKPSALPASLHPRAAATRAPQVDLQDAETFAKLVAFVYLLKADSHGNLGGDRLAPDCALRQIYQSPHS
jgi:hypothetical protein